MYISIIDSLDKIAAAQWNSLAGNHFPFLRHEFLSALEHSGCTTHATGWQPQHLVMHAHGKMQGPLIGAVPMYLKTHSYGEYVFDWAWANAYARAGMNYYPKVVMAIPFTPATGPRLLIAADQSRPEIAQKLIVGARAYAQQIDASSIHWLFPTAEETQWLEHAGLMRRIGCQFHWENKGYADFDAFLDSFSAQKRKKLKRERRYVSEAQIQMEVLTGPDLTTADWDTFYAFYRATTAKHGAIAYLTRAFFQEIGKTMAQDIILIFARHEDRHVAGALNFRGADILYGRYWGALENFHSLHFETCYYRAIEYCIAHGLKRFEAGAQGEHKLSRGFLPSPTYSAHWLSHPEFSQAVADFLCRENNGVEYYMNELSDHSPFKNHCV